MLFRIINKYKMMPAAVKASLWFTICSILQKGISFITVPIFTRILPVDELGVYSLFLSWQNIICIFATLNLSYQVFNNGMIKFADDKYGYTTAMLGLSNLATIILLVIYFVFHNSFNRIMSLDTPYIILMFIGFFFSSATSLWTVQQRYMFKYRALCIVTLLTTVLSAIFGILFVISFKTGLSRVVSDTIVLCLFGFIIYIIIIKKNHKLINVKYWMYALKLDLPLLMHYLSMSVLNGVDRIMINSICGKRYTAYYSVPYNASMIMQIVINSVNASFIPWTYQQLKNKSYEKLKSGSTFLIVFIAVLSLIPSLFAPEIVWILGGKGYANSVWVIPPVSCSVFFIFLYSIFSNIELFYEKSKNIMIASIFASVSNIVLNFIFIKLFGYIAAAYTTLACYILLSIMHYIFMKKVLQENNIISCPYNMKIIFGVSMIVIVYSFFVTVLFKYHWIFRYILIFGILFIMLLKKEYLVKTFKNIR